MGSFYMEATQINYRRDDTFKTVDQKLQELSETSAIDTDIAPVFKSTNTYAPGDMVYYRSKLYTFNVEHSGAWAAGDVTATDVTTEISSLRRGLTNVQDDVKLNTQDLTTPSRTKNLLPMTVDGIKAANTDGTWSGNTYTHNGISYTMNTDSNGNITSIDISGTNTDNSQFNITNRYIPNKYKNVILNGYNGGSKEEDKQNELYVSYSNNGYNWASDLNCNDGDVALTKDYPYIFIMIIIRAQTNFSKTIYPMIRPATITDPTFAPYIPSVESRIEAVESGDYKVIASVTSDGVKTVAQLLPDLFNSVPAITKKCSLIYGKSILPMAEKTTNNTKFGNVSNYQGATSLLSVNIQSSTAYFTEVSIASTGTITVTDRSTEVPTNGAVISLVQ